MRQIIILLVFSIVTNTYAQTSCTGGFAGAYPCNDYDLLSSIDVNTLAGTTGPNIIASDNWGWVDPMDGSEYVIMGMSNRTAFVNITDPLNPVYLGYLPRTSGSSINFWRDVKVYNNHAFIVADNVGAQGMQVFDLTNLRNVASPPAIFSALTTYTAVNSCHNIAINETTGFAYLVGCGRSAPYLGGPQFIDIRDPSNPTFAGAYTGSGYTHDAQVVTYAGPDISYIGREILVAANENEVVIVNVTDKANPQLISTVSYSNVSYTHQGWFTDDFKYYIVGDEGDEGSFGFNSRTLVFDVTDLDNPVLHTTYLGPNAAIDHNLYVIGDLLYEANYTAGLRVIDISDIDNSTTTNNTFTEVGYFDSYPANNNTTTNNGAWNVYPFFPSGNIVISDQDNGMLVVRKSGTLSTSGFKQESFTMYPNPSSEETIISTNTSNRFNAVTVSNTLGQKIPSFDNLDTDKFVIPNSSLSKGVYLVNIDNSITKKLVIN